MDKWHAQLEGCVCVCAHAWVFYHIFSIKWASFSLLLPLGLWPSIVFLSLHNLYQGFFLPNSLNIILPSLSQRKQKTLGKFQLHLVICKVIYIFAHYSYFSSFLNRIFSILCVIIPCVLNPITSVPYLRPNAIIYQRICSFLFTWLYFLAKLFS